MPRPPIRSSLCAVLLAVPWLLAATSLHAGGGDCAIQSSSVFLDPVGSDPHGSFGSAVAVDGTWIAVGAAGGASAAGRVEMFHHDGGMWTHHSILTPPDGAVNDRFGGVLSLRGDTLLVGASKAAGAMPETGAVHVFRLTGDQWTHESKLVADDSQPQDAFGADVHVAGDIAVIAAPKHDSLGPDAGAVYVFERSERTWTFRQKLTAPDGEAGDQFGHTVELEGETIAVGAPFDDVDGDEDRGSLHLFERLVEHWVQSAQISLNKTYTYRIGLELQLRNGTMLASVGRDGSPFPLAVMVFERRAGRWGSPQYVTTPISDTPFFPQVLALADDGGSAAWVVSSGGMSLPLMWRDDGLWITEQSVGPPAPMTGISLAAVAFDGVTLVGGKVEVAVDGVAAGRAFASDVPPRDRDHDGLDDACEIATGLAEDCEGDGIIDDAQRPFQFMADSEPADSAWVVLSPFIEVMILNRFVTTADGQTVKSLSWFRPEAAPLPITCGIAVVYSDPDGDGAPFDAALLRAQAAVLLGNEPEWVNVALDEVELGPKGTSFFVGLYFPYPSAPNAGSEAALPHRQTSWFLATGDPIDLANPAKSSPRPWEVATGLGHPASVVLLRAELSDCDGSGRLDSCEIADGTLEDEDGDGLPDTCPSLVVDVDGDGEPDVCPLSNADLDGDNGVGPRDVGLLLMQWGPCPELPQPCSADLNLDGVVDGADLGILLGAWPD